jgi:hypothetical protein
MPERVYFSDGVMEEYSRLAGLFDLDAQAFFAEDRGDNGLFGFKERYLGLLDLLLLLRCFETLNVAESADRI